MDSTSEWFIGLEGWVLKDGNYTDFSVGDVRQFALEFGYARSARLQVAELEEPACRHTGRGEWYDVRGKLVRDSPEPMGCGFILDFGLLAYDNWMVLDDLNPPTAGTWLEGEIALQVDPFEYMDRLATQTGMLPLIYTWKILGIELDVSPTIIVEHGHPLHVGPDEGPMRVKHPERERYESIERTRTWADEGSYRLRCALQPEPATTSMALSGKRSPYGPL